MSTKYWIYSKQIFNRKAEKLRAELLSEQNRSTETGVLSDEETAVSERYDKIDRSIEMQEVFSHWLYRNGYSKSLAESYIRDLGFLGGELKRHGFEEWDVFAITDTDKLNDIKQFLLGFKKNPMSVEIKSAEAGKLLAALYRYMWFLEKLKMGVSYLEEEEESEETEEPEEEEGSEEEEEPEEVEEYEDLSSKGIEYYFFGDEE